MRRAQGPWRRAEWACEEVAGGAVTVLLVGAWGSFESCELCVSGVPQNREPLVAMLPEPAPVYPGGCTAWHTSVWSELESVI